VRDHLPVLVIVVPLLTALLIPLVTRIWRGAAWWMTAGAVIFSASGAITMLVDLSGQDPDARIVYAMGGWSERVSALGITYVVDLLNAIVLVMIAVIAVAAVVWMRRSVTREIPRPARTSWYAVFLLCCTGYLGITITGDIFNLYVFLEIASITTYVLIGMGRGRKALYASYSYLIVGSIGATFILLGIGHLYMQIGTLDMADIAATFAARPEYYDSSVVRTSFAFFTVGLAIKMALFPLHGWQPSAYTEAPSAASLFIAATATKVSAYAFYRISFSVFGIDFLTDALPAIREGVVVMATAAIVVGPLIAIRQSNLKRLLAYSSVGQIGYIMLGIVLLNSEGVTGGLIHFWNHAAAKGALFCVAGALVYASGAARVESLAGMGRTAPWTSAVLTVAGCSMVGVPLTAGFLSKWYLGAGALEADRWYIVPVLLTSSLFTAIYVWRLLQLVWFAPKDTVPDVSKEVPWSMRAPALALAAACLVFGLTPWSVDIARSAAAGLGMPSP
jgi:multicomponent Na+:H+ antiporter subunit D